MPKEISLLVLIEVKPRLRDKQIDVYKELAPLVLAEKGCLQYELKAVENKENEFVLLEKWESIEALSAHDVTEHMIEADASNSSYRAKPATVVKLFNI